MKAKSDKPFLPLQLRKARRLLNLSQKDVADKLDLHRNTVIRWESKLSEPSVLQAEALAHALGQSVDFFYTIPDSGLPRRQDEWMRQTPLKTLQELTPVALKRLLQARDVSVADIAAELKVQPKDVLEWMKGRAVPSEDDLARLRYSYGKDFDPTPVLARAANRSISQRLDRMEKLLFQIHSALKKAKLIDEENS